MTEQEKERLHPGGQYLYTAQREDGAYGWPPQVRYLTPEELAERRRLRNDGLCRIARLAGAFLVFKHH